MIRTVNAGLNRGLDRLRRWMDASGADEGGQATAEYALVLVAAAVVALALITWASTTNMLPTFFNTVMTKVISVADGVG